MPNKDTLTAYGAVTRFFHNRLIAPLVIFELLFGAVVSYFPQGSSIKGELFVFHKSLGIVIFFIALLFLVWRLFNVKPQWPSTMPTLERLLARLVHFLLYALIILMPFTGWGMSTAADKAPNFFWLFTFPMPFVPLSKPLAGFFNNLHYIFAWALTAALVLHVIGALKHHLIDKNDILKRMWR